MTRTVTKTLVYLNGTPRALGTLTWVVVDSFSNAAGEIIPAGTLTETLDANGYGSIDLETPASPATAHYEVHLPDKSSADLYIADGAPVDLVTLLTLAGTSVAPDPVQVLLDAAQIFTPTNVTATYQMLVADEYIRASGTFALTLVPAILTQPAVLIRNIGTGVITVTAAGSDTIDGATTKTLNPGDRLAFFVGATGIWET